MVDPAISDADLRRCTRAACAASASASSSGWSTMRPRTSSLKSPARLPTGWHVVVYFEADILDGAAAVPRRDAGAVGDRSHGPAGRRRRAPGRPGHARFRRLLDLPAGHLVQDDLSRSARSPRASPMAISSRAVRAARRGLSRIACCGAPTGRTPTWKPASPTMAGWST